MFTRLLRLTAAIAISVAVVAALVSGAQLVAAAPLARAAVLAEASARGQVGTPPSTPVGAADTTPVDRPLAGTTLPLVLINGDRLFVTGTRVAGSAGVVIPHWGLGASLTLRANGAAYEIPLVALPYLGRGLDPSLFDVGALQRLETAGRLRVRVGYRGRVPALPGVRITRAAAGTADGYLTASSARVFGAALDRQYLADRSRASYGTDGLFGRGVTVSLAGTTPARTASAGTGSAKTGTAGVVRGRAARDGIPMHTLTVTGTNLAGKPDTGDTAFVWNADNSRLSDPVAAFAPFYHGVAKFSVPAGHYWAVGIFGPPGFTGPAPAHLPVLPQFNVAANTTVHLAERAADSPIAMVTPRPAVVREDNFYLVRQPAKGPQVQLQFINVNSSISVSPVSTPTTVGWVRAFASEELTSPPGHGVPYTYALSYAGPRGTIPAQRYVVRAADLATVSDSYYQDVPSPGYWAVFGSYPDTFNGYVEPDLFRASLPGRRILYLGGSPMATWGSYYSATGTGNGNAQFEDFRAIRPGEHLAESWNRYPLHPAEDAVLAPKNELTVFLPSADRAGNKLTLEVTPFGDNQPGHLPDGFAKIPGVKVTGSYLIDENGRRIAGGNTARLGRSGPFYTRVALSPRPSTVSFTLNAARTGPGLRLSTATRTVWTWRSAHEAGHTLPQAWYCYNPPSGVVTSLPRHCAVEPMMTLNYRVARLALDGSAPPGRQVLTVAAGHIQLAKASAITGASVQVSFDGGKTWHRASVTRTGAGTFRAVFTAPAGADVTLRTTAHDAAGGGISETITDGYAIAAHA